jgi:alpha-L-rhamnosidase
MAGVPSSRTGVRVSKASAVLRSAAALRGAVFALVLVHILAPDPVRGQDPARPSNAVPEPWSASWIIHREAPADSFGVFHFRRSFDLTVVPDSFVVHVSADNRYRLFLNGQSVSHGPALGDLLNWRYETVDLAPHLRRGTNVLAAVVWNYGAHKPVAQISYRTAFLVQGATPAAEVVNTGPEWKVLWNRGYAPVPVTREDIGNAYYASPPGESLDGRAYPWGWEQPEFSDTDWASAQLFVFRQGTVAGALPPGSHPYGEAGGWQLVPRPLPMMEETPQRIPRLRRSRGVSADDAFLQGAGDLVIPAETRATLVLDQAFVTNAYPVLHTSGGTGATVKLTYAEAAIDAEGRKGHRDEVEGRTIRGVNDRFVLDGGARRRFSPLMFRTFRYIEIDVQTADEPLHIHDVYGIFTGYPLEERARFTSDLPWLERMWEIN